MIPRKLQTRLRALTDALIRAESLEASFLASVLLAAEEAVEGGETATFALDVWRINNRPESKAAREGGPPAPPTPKRQAKRRKAG